MKDLQLTWHLLRQRRNISAAGKTIGTWLWNRRSSIDFAKSGYIVTGGDIAPTVIEWAIENAAKANVDVRFIQGDVLTLVDVADESFDIALNGCCFHYIIGSDRQQFLQSAHRILRPGEVLTICSMCN